MAPAPKRSAIKVVPVSSSSSRPVDASSSAASAPKGPASAPLILSTLENVNDFNLLANGGFDSGWRVGHDTAWVVKLPPVPAGRWKKAFLGAKIGRAKLEPVPGRPPWEKRRISGDLDVAVAAEPLWPHSRRFPLARTRDIPLEGDPDNATAGVGESRWFWTEVPIKILSASGPNFVALFSPSDTLKGPDRAPVLAAGPRPASLKEANVWLSANRRGQPPLGAVEAFKTPVKTYAPAVAIKLVPENDFTVEVSLAAAPEDGQVLSAPFQLSAVVSGADVSRAWVETSTDTKKWTPVGPAILTPPYSFTVNPAALPAGEAWLRVLASDAWENVGSSEERRVIAAPKKK